MRVGLLVESVLFNVFGMEKFLEAICFMGRCIALRVKVWIVMCAILCKMHFKFSKVMQFTRTCIQR